MRSMRIGSTGTLRSNGPPPAVGRWPMSSTTSMPSTTSTEHRVAPARRPRVQVDVVGQVDVELARRGMRLGGARERDRAAQIAQAVAGLVDDVLGDGLLLSCRVVVAARLRDEPGDDAVKDRAGIEPGFTYFRNASTVLGARPRSSSITKLPAVVTTRTRGCSGDGRRRPGPRRASAQQGQAEQQAG